ncbi:MAG: hypothetical protein JWR24_1864 [Actinoallomurus sp.]|nr:hypothetical protein [Actinoallomurus sp.]
MAAEMAEQPTVLTALAERFETITQEVRSLVGQRIAGVAFLARGSSDNAALLAGTGPADPDTREVRGDLLRRGARVTLIGTGDGVDIAWAALGDLGECLLATVRGQQLAHATATALGIDPDRPTGLNKVTLTH